jgi:nucleoside-diphosphate-sugar epimerase
MRVLVTGATGFIGRHAVRMLSRAGFDVACLVRKSGDRRGLDDPRVSFVEGDLSDAGSLARALENAGAVLHLASLLKVPWKPEFRTVNIGGTEAIARAAAARVNPPVLVVVSTLATAGPATNGRPHRETDEPRPISRYGRMKLDAELASRAFADQIPLTIVRPPMVLGEGDRFGLKLFRSVARGFHVVPSFGAHQMSLIHVEDLAEVLIAATERGERVGKTQGSGIYYVADDARPTYAELGLLVGAACKTKPRVIRVPSAISGIAALAGELIARIRDQPTIFNLDKWREATAGSWICDPGKAKRELGFAPKNLEARLEQTAAWYRREGWL